MQVRTKNISRDFSLAAGVFTLILFSAVFNNSNSVYAQDTNADQDLSVEEDPFSPASSPAVNNSDVTPAPSSNVELAPSTTIQFNSSGSSGIRDRELFLVKDIPQAVDFDYDIGEIAVGNPAVASVVVDRPKRRMLISPLQVGDTAILVFDTRGSQRDKIQLTVTSTDFDQFTKDLKFLFRDIEGLSTRRVGNKIIIEGEVYLAKDLQRIQDVLKGNNFVVNLVTLSQDTQRILAKRIKNEIDISGVEVTTARDRIVLKGTVVTKDDKERAEKIASIYVSPDKIVNVIAVDPNKQGARPDKLVQVSAYFVELNKAFLRSFNFSWTPIANVQAGFQTPSGDANPFSFFAVLTDFLPKLNTAKALGVARVFENPTVSVKSGKNASLFSGKQLILANSNPDAPNSFSSPVNLGVTLDVTPTADDRDFVDLSVSVDVSSLGSSPQGTAVSSGDGVSVLINQSKISTSHYIRSGETVAIGGILRAAFTDVKDAPPGQAFSFQSPLANGVSLDSSFGNLFQIFKSRSITQDRSLFIVFLTPEILISARDASRELKDHVNMRSLEPVEGGANTADLE